MTLRYTTLRASPPDSKCCVCSDRLEDRAWKVVDKRDGEEPIDLGHVCQKCFRQDRWRWI